MNRFDSEIIPDSEGKIKRTVYQNTNLKFKKEQTVYPFAHRTVYNLSEINSDCNIDSDTCKPYKGDVKVFILEPTDTKIYVITFTDGYQEVYTKVLSRGKNRIVSFTFDGTNWVNEGNDLTDMLVINTTNNTPVSSSIISLSPDTSYIVEGKILIKQTGGTAGTVGDTCSYHFQFTIKNISGTAYLVGILNTFAVQGDGASLDTLGNPKWLLNIIPSGTGFLYQLTGENNKILKWNIVPDSNNNQTIN